MLEEAGGDASTSSFDEKNAEVRSAYKRKIGAAKFIKIFTLQWTRKVYETF